MVAHNFEKNGVVVVVVVEGWSRKMGLIKGAWELIKEEGEKRCMLSEWKEKCVHGKRKYIAVTR